jgi:UDP-glucose 6-dehydrogenase
MKIGIIGGKGFVGKAMVKLFPDALIFDSKSEQSEIDSCDAVFVCVPTNLKEGELDISIVESVVEKCKSNLIIIRSTLNPGTCDYLEEKYKKNIVMMPEYVGETVSHPLLNEATRSFLVIGGKEENRRKVIELMQTVYNANINIRQVSNLEAEIIKLTENRAIAFKMMQCQELYDVCEKAGINYYTVRDAVYGDDPRFNLWFTFVYPDKRGFNNSKCLKKDVPAWVTWARKVGIYATLTQMLVLRSDVYEMDSKAN